MKPKLLLFLALPLLLGSASPAFAQDKGKAAPAKAAKQPAQYAASVPAPTLSEVRYGDHAFGFASFATFLEGREKILPWIAEYSPYALVSAGDPPVYMIFSAAPALGQEQKDPTHTANFGVKLQEHCNAIGVPCELVYPGAPEVEHATPTDFFIATLKPTAK